MIVFCCWYRRYLEESTPRNRRFTFCIGIFTLHRCLAGIFILVIAQQQLEATSGLLTMTSLTIRCSPRVDTTSIRKTLLSPTSPLSSFTHSRSPREPSTKTSEPRTTLRQQAPADVKPSSPPADIDPSLPVADRLVLRTLLQDIDKTEARRNRTNIRYGETTSDEQTLRQLAALSDTTTKQFEPSAYASWKNSDFHPWINKYLLQPYTVWATTVVRHPKDVPYLTAMLTFLTLGLPNFVSLFRSFNWYQGIFQWVWVSYHVAPYTMLMHWHHHSRFLSRSWSRVDQLFPYLLSPMMGWTWNSFHYHHKQHHIEDNGPDDISSTLRYQRDSAFDFFMYVARFIFLCWLELPLYYARKNKLRMACKVFAWEITSYAFLFGMAKLNFRAAMMAMILPLIQWRIVIMASNWGHHGFIDEVEPSAPIRCSTNYVDVMVRSDITKDAPHAKKMRRMKVIIRCTISIPRGTGQIIHMLS